MKELSQDNLDLREFQMLPATTAGIFPDKFPEVFEFAKYRWAVITALVFIIVVGFMLRTNGLGTESLGEDELNKLNTVAEYRQNGLSGKNGEHPFLMKGLQTISITVAEKLNSSILDPAGNISEEAALRFPIALFGTFTALLIFLLLAELFGKSFGIVAAALWAVEPVAIGFDRIAKEDSLVLFFFLLTSLFWIKSQTAAERGDPNWFRTALVSAAGFAGLMASKYYPHLLAIIGAYYNVFINLPNKKWDLGKKRWLIFALVMGTTFLVLNPTILLPDTWREMLKFSTENRIGHDSYEFMGTLFPNKMSAWLSGVPWTFYYVFIAVKQSLAVLIFFVIGLPLMFRRRMGDGRFYLFFWAFMWFLPFTFLGGKFTRYFTFVEPLILIVAAVGVVFSIKWLCRLFGPGNRFTTACQIVMVAIFLAFPIWNALKAAPHYRLFTNDLGGGRFAAGDYFPHDEFYDAATRETLAVIFTDERIGIKVATETPELFAHYAKKVGRTNILFIPFSDHEKMAALGVGDYAVVTSGRRYFSNTPYIEGLSRSNITPHRIEINGRLAANIYKLNIPILQMIDATAK